MAFSGHGYWGIWYYIGPTRDNDLELTHNKHQTISIELQSFVRLDTSHYVAGLEPMICARLSNSQIPWALETYF